MQQSPIIFGDIHVLKGEYAEAEREYEKIAKGSAPYRDRMTALYISQGRFQAAKDILKKDL